MSERGRKAFKQYTGPLSTAQAAAGIEAALRNASALLADAELLLKYQRWQRSTALSILAIEESGKVGIFRGLLLARNEKELKDEWRSYRSHSAKNVAHMLPAFVAGGARQLEDFRPIYDKSSDYGHKSDALKQLAFYSDALGDECHWSSPGESVSPELANSTFKIAKLIVERDPGGFTSEAELDIWVKHMRPVWKKETNQIKKALLACYAEARAKGVLRGKYDEDSHLRFLFGDPVPPLV